MKPYRASYILPDGSVFRCEDYGYHSHYSYELALQKKGEIEKLPSKYRQLTNLRQWIRINDGSLIEVENIIELPIKGITNEHYKALLEFLDYMLYNNKKFVEVGIEEHSIGLHITNKSIWFKIFYFNDYLPDDIIKEIKQQYNKLTA